MRRSLWGGSFKHPCKGKSLDTGNFPLKRAKVSLLKPRERLNWKCTWRSPVPCHSPTYTQPTPAPGSPISTQWRKLLCFLDDGHDDDDDDDYGDDDRNTEYTFSWVKHACWMRKMVMVNWFQFLFLFLALFWFDFPSLDQLRTVSQLQFKDVAG